MDDELLREARNALERHGNHVAKPICMTCELIARIDARLASGGWLPIESAPKDGTEFLGYRKRDGALGNCYRVQRDDCEMWRFRDTSASHERFPDVRPDFWRPLPELPKGES